MTDRFAANDKQTDPGPHVSPEIDLPLARLGARGMNTGGGNALSADDAITPNGGGLYTDGPVMLTGDYIVGNAPNDGSGVSC